MSTNRLYVLLSPLTLALASGTAMAQAPWIMRGHNPEITVVAQLDRPSSPSYIDLDYPTISCPPSGAGTIGYAGTRSDPVFVLNLNATSTYFECTSDNNGSYFSQDGFAGSMDPFASSSIFYSHVYVDVACGFTPALEGTAFYKDTSLIYAGRPSPDTLHTLHNFNNGHRVHSGPQNNMGYPGDPELVLDTDPPIITWDADGTNETNPECVGCVYTASEIGPGSYAFFNPRALSKNGVLAFTSGASNLWDLSTYTPGSPGSFSLLLSYGDMIPVPMSFETFISIDDVTINDNDEVAFTAIDSASAWGIYADVGGTLTPVVRAGDQLPVGGISTLPCSGSEPSLPPIYLADVDSVTSGSQRMVYFGARVSTLSGNMWGIWSWTPTGGYSLVVLEGDPVPGVFNQYFTGHWWMTANRKGDFAFQGYFDFAPTATTHQGVWYKPRSGALSLGYTAGQTFDDLDSTVQSIDIVTFETGHPGVFNGSPEHGFGTRMDNQGNLALLINFDGGKQAVVRLSPCPSDSCTSTSCPCPGDFNGDSDFGTDQDIEAFFACLGGNCCPTCLTADVNCDGDFGTDQDVEAFFSALGGSCGL